MRRRSSLGGTACRADSHEAVGAGSTRSEVTRRSSWSSRTPRRRSSGALLFDVDEDEADAAADPSTPRLQRQISFAEATLREVYASIGTASKDVLADLSTGYLEAILLGRLAPSFRELQKRTLSFWVQCYNRWLAMEEPPTLNFEQLQHVFDLRPHVAMSVASLFNKQEVLSHRLSMEGRSSRTLGGIKVSACGVMLAGVWLSPIIATQNKITFAFGLFDKDDSGALSEKEFCSLAHAIFAGMALVFGAEPPPPSALHRLTAIYYRQISAHAGRCIRNALGAARSRCRRTRGVSLRDVVEQQVRERQTAALESRTQHVPYSVLQDFVFGAASEEDPLTLPFRLLLERFNPNRSVTFMDEFIDEMDTTTFRLSHSAPVSVPQDQCVSGMDLLTRPEVVFTREMYEELFELTAVVAEADIVKRMDESRFVKIVRQDVQTRLILLNKELCVQSIKLRGADGLFKMWKKVCPRAQPQHLKMFEKWCQEYDELTERRSRLEAAQSAMTTFQGENLKPLIPAADLQRIKDEFSRLDTYGEGIIDGSRFARWLQLGDAWEVIRLYDSNDDGYIDANEFVRMMCPPEYRLPEMNGIGRRLFGELIEHEATALENQCNQQAAYFEKSAEGSHRLSGATPRTLLPEVDKRTWATWNATFDLLDSNSDAKVTVPEVIGSGLLSADLATFVCQVLIPEDGNSDGFSREDFMSAMLRAHGVRRPHSWTKEACLGG